jgi:Rod binding domain-containing protein
MHGIGYPEFTAVVEKAGCAADWSELMQPVSPVASATLPGSAPDAALARAARDLEAAFLSVMLRDSGVATTPDSFGGGIGEDQFASFLTDAYAAKMAERGGIGLAEAIFRSLKERSDDPA